MDEKKILERIEKLGTGLPRFPDGRIDYSKAKAAPVVIVFVRYKDEILILKRSQKVRTYKGRWNTVAGYLDEPKPINEKVLEELREEVGILKNEIKSIDFGKPFRINDKGINKVWFAYPVLVELKERPTIRIDWEHTDYRWIKLEELKKFDLVPNFVKGLKSVLR